MDESNNENSEWNKISRDMFKNGFREGAVKGKEIGHQKGFDQGYQEGFKIGQSLDHTIGILKVLNKEQDSEIYINFKNQIKNPLIENCIICEEEKKPHSSVNSQLIEKQLASNKIDNILEKNKKT